MATSHTNPLKYQLNCEEEHQYSNFKRLKLHQEEHQYDSSFMYHPEDKISFTHKMPTEEKYQEDFNYISPEVTRLEWPNHPANTPNPYNGTIQHIFPGNWNSSQVHDHLFVPANNLEETSKNVLEAQDVYFKPEVNLPRPYAYPKIIEPEHRFACLLQEEKYFQQGPCTAASHEYSSHISQPEADPKTCGSLIKLYNFQDSGNHYRQHTHHHTNANSQITNNGSHPLHLPPVIEPENSLHNQGASLQQQSFARHPSSYWFNNSNIESEKSFVTSPTSENDIHQTPIGNTQIKADNAGDTSNFIKQEVCDTDTSMYHDGVDTQSYTSYNHGKQSVRRDDEVTDVNGKKLHSRFQEIADDHVINLKTSDGKNKSEGSYNDYSKMACPNKKKLADYIKEYEDSGLCKVIEDYVERTMKYKTSQIKRSSDLSYSNPDTKVLKEWPLYAHIATVDKIIPLNGTKSNHWCTIEDLQDEDSITVNCDDWLSNQVEIQEMKEELIKTFQDMSVTDNVLTSDTENLVTMFKIFIERRTRFFFSNKFYCGLAESDKTRLLCRAVAVGVFIMSCGQMDVNTYSWPNKNSKSIFSPYCMKACSRNFRHALTTEQYIRIINFCTKYNKLYSDDSIMVLMQILALFKETSGLCFPEVVKQGWCHYINTLKCYLIFTYGRDKAKALLKTLIQSMDDAFFLCYTTKDLKVMEGPLVKPDRIKEPDFRQDINNIGTAAYDTLITVILNKLTKMIHLESSLKEIKNSDISTGIKNANNNNDLTLFSTDKFMTVALSAKSKVDEETKELNPIYSAEPSTNLKQNYSKLDINKIKKIKYVLERIQNSNDTKVKTLTKKILSVQTLNQLLCRLNAENDSAC